MNNSFLEKSSSVFLKLTIALFTLTFLYEIACYLLIDFPFNAYEPEVLMDAWGLSQGQDLYPSRQVGPIAGLYAPFFHITVAVLFSFLPNTLLTARLVSVLSLIGSALIINKSAKNLPFHTLISFFGILIWHYVLAEFDMHAKPDSYAVFLGLLSVYFIIKKEILSISDIVLSGLFATLSVATKQSMLCIPVGIGLALLIQRNYKIAFQFGLSFLVSSLFIWWIFFKTLGPDMWFFVFEQPGKFSMSFVSIALNFWYIQSSFIWFITVPFALILLKAKTLSKNEILLCVVVLLALPASVLTAAKGGGSSNAYQPFLYVVSWLFILLLNSNWENGFQLKKYVTSYKWVVFFAISFVMWNTLRPNIPSIWTSIQHRMQIHQSYSALAHDLQQMEGSLFVPLDNYLSLKAGKPLRWSLKWQKETSLRVGNRPPEIHSDIAYKSDIVVTTNNYEWTSDIDLEPNLLKKGFVQKRIYKMGQFKEYRVWQKSKELEPKE